MATNDFRQRIGSLHNGISTQSASSRFPSQVEDAENALFTVVNGVGTRAGSRHWTAFTASATNSQYYRAHRIVRDATEKYMVVYGRGSSNTMLRIVDLSNPRNRIQHITGPASSTFTITFGGQTTGNLNFNDSAATVETALAALSTVGSGNVTVTRTGSGPYVYRCVFNDALVTQTVATVSSGSVVGNVITPTFNGTTQTYLDSGSPTADDLRLLTIVDTTIICNTKQATGTGTKTTFSTTHTKIDETKFPVKLVRTGLAPPAFAVSFMTQSTELKDANTDNASWRAPKPFQDATIISDIAYHRGRLCLAMGESVVCSQPNDIFNFFPFSSTTYSANPADPINVQIGSNTVSLIDFMVPFRKSLLLLTRSGTQFELGGDETFTATNATFVPSTTYATQRVRPTAVSSMIYLAGTREDTSLIYEYVYDDIQVSNRANNISQHIEGLLPANIRSLVGSDNNDTLVVVPEPTATDPTSTITSNGLGGGLWSNPSTWIGNKVPGPTNTTVISSGDTVVFDSYGKRNSLFVYRQMRVADKIIQSAWTRYSFGSDIINDAIAIDDTLYILRYRTASGTTTLIVESMPLTSDPSPPASFTEQPRLDHRHVIKGGTFAANQTSWTLPYEDTSLNRVAYMDNGQWKELYLIVSGTTATSSNIPGTVIPFSGNNLTGKLVVLGRAIPFRMTVTRLYQQDGDGNPIIEGELEVNKVVTDHRNSGPYKIVAGASGRSDREFAFTPSDGDFDQQGRFSAWCVGRSNDLYITITNTDSRPTVLTGIEYYGRHTSTLPMRKS